MIGASSAGEVTCGGEHLASEYESPAVDRAKTTGVPVPMGSLLGGCMPLAGLPAWSKSAKFNCTLRSE